MENRVKEICKSKGLRMSDLAARVGMSQSNLCTTLRRNPKLSSLEDIARALGIRVSDLIEPQRSMNEAGVVIIDSKTYVLSKPTIDVVQMPVYKDYSKLRETVKEFVNKSIKDSRDGAICGMVEAFEVFNLLFDSRLERFYLTLCYGNGKMHICTYDKLEYILGEMCNMTQLYQDIIYDIEGIVLTKIGYKANITQKEVDNILFASEE